METIFGAEMPIAAKVLLALMIVIALAGGVFYLVRYVSAGRFGTTALRGRQPRLALIEVAGIDARRSLVLIRRDNVEHLLMIGGPTDVVVEPNILRAVAVGATRDAPQTRAAAGAEPSRAMADATMWPQQTEPAARQSRPAAPEETIAWPQATPAQPEPTPRSAHAADPLAGLAAELGRTPGPATPAEGAPREPRRNPPQAAPTPQATAAADQNLTEMAQRLEAALRQSPGARTGEPPRPAPEVKPAPRLTGINGGAAGIASGPPAINGGATGAAEQPPPRPAASEPRPPRPDGKPASPKAVYDSLEAEMASLLGRPAGKT